MVVIVLKLHPMKTPFGWMTACFSQKGLAYLTLPCGNLDNSLNEVWNKYNNPMICSQILKTYENIKNRNSNAANLYISLLQYFKGNTNRFFVPVDWSVNTDFAKKVYEAVITIPHGEVRTYGWVAEKIGKHRAAQAVGQALKKNPYPIVIPCHRVVAVNGLGGFGGEINIKKKLLELEGYKISEETGS
jgi:O-6-methylguanine DNA methyltransferase